MGNVTEIQECKNWIYDQLAAEASITAVVSGRIYADHYPGERVFPYVLFNLMAATDVNGLGTVREQTQAVFQIRIVTKGAPDSNAKLVDKLLDDLFQTQVNTLSGEFYFSSRREGTIDRPEYDNAQQRYHNSGGLYRIWIRTQP
jgi:hypothetical protein